MLRFLKQIHIAFVRTMEHDQFAVAKAAAYSAILTLFPAVLLIASILTASHSTLSFIREISFAIGRIMPSGHPLFGAHIFRRAQARTAAHDRHHLGAYACGPAPAS